MRWLKRLFSARPSNNSFAADYAKGDWSPVPVTATAQAFNGIGWFDEAERSQAGAPERPRRSTLQRLAMIWRDGAAAAKAHQASPPPTATASSPPQASAAASPAQAAPASEPGAGAADGRAADLLKLYGDHLTEEELQIIRKQLT